MMLLHRRPGGRLPPSPNRFRSCSSCPAAVLYEYHCMLFIRWGLDRDIAATEPTELHARIACALHAHMQFAKLHARIIMTAY